MFCDNCGKSNVSGAKKCRYCGYDMPEQTGGNGFSDILSFNPEPEVKAEETFSPVQAEVQSEYDYAPMRDTVEEDKNKRIVLLSIAALAISVILFITSIIFFVCAGNKNDELPEEKPLKEEQTVPEEEEELPEDVVEEEKIEEEELPEEEPVEEEKEEINLKEKLKEAKDKASEEEKKAEVKDGPPVQTPAEGGAEAPVEGDVAAPSTESVTVTDEIGGAINDATIVETVEG